MKRWIWYLAAAAVIVGVWGKPFSGVDVAKLQPVEVIRLSGTEGWITVETDTGGLGRGSTLGAAFEDMEKTAEGRIFLETSDYLLVAPEAVTLLEDTAKYLRPGCALCLEIGRGDLKETAAFLAAHRPHMTLRDYCGGNERIPVLWTGEGRKYLVEG